MDGAHEDGATATATTTAVGGPGEDGETTPPASATAAIPVSPTPNDNGRDNAETLLSLGGAMRSYGPRGRSPVAVKPCLAAIPADDAGVGGGAIRRDPVHHHRPRC